MKIKHVVLRTFDECPKELQDRILANLRDINVDITDWADSVLDCYKDKLAAYGYDDAKIMYAGFWNQGDGACFTAKLNIAKLAKRHKIKGLNSLMGEASGVIIHNWRYYFATSTNVELDFPGNAGIEQEKAINALELAIKTERENIGNEIYKRLKDDYEYLTSDKAIIETIRANEYTFNENGEIEN